MAYERSDSVEKRISVLLLSTRWQFDTFGLSTVNKSLVNNLRVIDHEAKAVDITCTVLEEEGKVGEDELRDAEKHGVELRGARQPRGKRRPPKRKWLDESTATYYRYVIKETDYDFIIGHIPYLANGALNFKDLCEETGTTPKIIFMIHALPKTKEGLVDEELIFDWLKEADVVFSIGKHVESEVIPYVSGLEASKRPIHRIYLPAYPLEFFDIQREVKEKKVHGTQNISMMTAEAHDLEVSGLDFPLAISSIAASSEHIKNFDDVRTNLLMMTARQEDTKLWKENFDKVAEEKKFSTALSFHSSVSENITKVKTDLRRSNLFVFPTKPDSPVYGTEALTAAAAGVPILVSQDSGITSLLQSIYQDESLVKTKTQTWRERIIEKLVRPDEAQQTADRLREQLLLETSIAQTHLDFINTVTGFSCVPLEVEVEGSSGVPEESVAAAAKFGVDVVDTSNKINAQKYIVAFFQKLLLQREKLNQNLLVQHLKPEIIKLWQQVLSRPEEYNRRVTHVEHGSVVFKLFCPTVISIQQLGDEAWREALLDDIGKLLTELELKARVVMKPYQDAEIYQETGSVKLTSRHKSYRSVRSSEDESEGYETMTVTSSAAVSMVPPAELKVEKWLLGQSEESRKRVLDYVKTWDVSYIRNPVNRNYFSVSKTGAIAIASFSGKPTLSIFYPDTEKSPVVLSEDKSFFFAIFLSISGKEYLAATSNTDNCIHLWDLETNTSKVVYKMDFEGRKDMTLCVIDENTVAYAEWSSDGMHRIHVLNTDTEQWTLGNVILDKGSKFVRDICYVNTSDGNSCLVLCRYDDKSVQAVQFIGGRTKWKIGKEEMGKKFDPYSICPDQTGNAIYVSDFGKHMLHILSVDDGSVVTSVSLVQWRIVPPTCVRAHDNDVYIAHRDEKKQKLQISKFTRST